MVEEQFREHGKALVDLSQSLVSFERGRILQIVQSLKTQLLVSLGMIILAGGVLLPVLFKKIIHPLREIETNDTPYCTGGFQADCGS